jgi:winged helix DNA-binding protein
VSLDLVDARLRNQRLTGVPLTTPVDVVRWLGAVQAQEYTDSKWALALRSRRTSNAEIERAFTAGTILRTHVLRPTWHFVTPADIRWMLALTGPRISRALASYHRNFQIDPADFKRSEKAIASALRGGVQLTRQELKVALQRAGVNVDGVQRLAFLTIQAESDAVICSGGRRGKQFTYALLDERVPTSRSIAREEALAELTRRYFASHGPAQLHDFTWWSGLTVADARAGLEMVSRELESDTIDRRTYWLATKTVRALASPQRAHLLGLYDEYLIAYKDRSAALDLSRWTRDAPRDPFSAPVVVGGRVVGGWKKKVAGDRVVVTVTPCGRPGRADRRAVEDAAESYASFVGLDLELAWA